VRNLEAVELGLREAIFRDLCKVLEELLNDPALPVPEGIGVALPGLRTVVPSRPTTRNAVANATIPNTTEPDA